MCNECNSKSKLFDNKYDTVKNIAFKKAKETGKTHVIFYCKEWSIIPLIKLKKDKVYEYKEYILP